MYEPGGYFRHRFKKTGKCNKVFLTTNLCLTGREPCMFVVVDPEYVCATFKSLSRLGADDVDPHYLHRADSHGLDRTYRRWDDQVHQVSDYAPPMNSPGYSSFLELGSSDSALRKAHAVYPITAMQVATLSARPSPRTLDS